MNDEQFNAWYTGLKEFKEKFDDSYEDWYSISPVVCRRCGSMVAHDYANTHFEWHKEQA